MVVVESVVHMSAIATVADDAGRSKQPQRLGHLGLARTHRRGDLVNAQLVGVGERSEDPDPGRVGEQPEQVGGGLCRRIIDRGFRRHLHICEYIKMFCGRQRGRSSLPWVCRTCLNLLR